MVLKDMSKYEAIENDKGGYCLVKLPSNDDAREQSFRTFCGEKLFFKKADTNLRHIKPHDQCTCIKCLTDFHK